MKRREFLAAAALLQQPGAALPLHLRFADAEGRTLQLRDLFDGRRAVLLVPGYYRCPQLCGLVMQALLQALERTGLPRDQYRIAGFSLDAAESPAAARARQQADLAFAQYAWRDAPARAPLDLRLLVGPPTAGAQLAAALGVRYTQVGDTIEHPAVVAVATADGRVSRYLPGLEFDPAELRVALADARGDRVAGIADRIALFCSHFEPQAGRHNALVMDVARGTGLASAALLGAWCWRRRGGAK